MSLSVHLLVPSRISNSKSSYYDSTCSNKAGSQIRFARGIVIGAPLDPKLSVGKTVGPIMTVVVSVSVIKILNFVDKILRLKQERAKILIVARMKWFQLEVASFSVMAFGLRTGQAAVENAHSSNRSNCRKEVHYAVTLNKDRPVDTLGSPLKREYRPCIMTS